MVKTKRQFTLLLVDDNPTNLLLLEKIIELDLPQVRTITVPSALEGLQLADQEIIDGAFIDVQMPQMGGLEMCRQLRAKPQTATIPLVLMTAHIAAPVMRAEGLEAGAYDFISQPISNVEMLARIKVMLRLCESEQRSLTTNQQLQQRLTEHTDRLRWIRGLLIAGDGPAAEPDQQLLHQLAKELPELTNINEKMFSEELLDEFPLPWRRTLLKLSLLDCIPVSLAQKLSEIADVAAVFDYLNRHQFSIAKTHNGENCFFISPQLKDLLRSKVEKYIPENEQQQVCLLASDWYQKKQDFSAALECLIVAEQYAAVSQLLSQRSFVLLHKKNRPKVFSLLDRIPENIVATCGWLSLFRGISHLQVQSIEADTWLKLAYQLFSCPADPRGKLFTLAQQARQAIFLDGIFTNWQERLPIFRKLATNQLELLEPVERLKVSYSLGLAELFFGDSFTAVDLILAKALPEAQQLQLPEQQLELNLLWALHALHQGRYLVAQTALERGLTFSIETGDLLENAVLQVVACELLHAHGDLVGFQKQRQIMATGDNQQRSIFMPLLSYYAASLLLAKGDRQRALETLEIALLDKQTATSSHLQSRLRQLRGLVNALAGHKTEALDDLDAGLNLRHQAGGALFHLENLLFAGATSFVLQDYKQASIYLADCLAESLKHKEERFRTGIHAWMAVAQLKLDKPQAAAEQLQLFFELLKRHRVTFFWALTPELIAELLPLMKHESERQLLQSLLKRHLLSALVDEQSLIPLLKISCLGGFQLELGRKTFDLYQLGQTSRQIFALLVVAPNHSLSTELLMGILWPESSPQKARNSFDTAHLRLRKDLERCFGEQIRCNYLVLEKGMLSLRQVQIDSTIFAETISTVRYQMQRDNFWQAELALWKMEQLWNGEFLSGYDLSCSLSGQQNQLTQIRLEQLGILARLLLRRQQPAEAIRLLLQGLSLEPTYDPVVRQLLSLYRQQHDSHAAALLLKNYRTALLNEEYQLEEVEELMESLTT